MITCFFKNLSIDNPNDQTVEIAERELNTIIEDGCGLKRDDVEETEELHNIPMEIKVIVVPGNKD